MSPIITDLFAEIHRVWGDRPEQAVCERLVRHTLTQMGVGDRLVWSRLAEIGEAENPQVLMNAVFYLAGDRIRLLKQGFEAVDETGAVVPVADEDVVAGMKAPTSVHPMTGKRIRRAVYLKLVRPYFTVSETALQGKAPRAADQGVAP